MRKSIIKTFEDYGFTPLIDEVAEELCWVKEINGVNEYMNKEVEPNVPYNEETGDFIVSALPYHKSVFQLIHMKTFKDMIMQQSITKVDCMNNESKDKAYDKICRLIKGKRVIVRDYDKYYIHFNREIFERLYELNKPEIYILDKDVEEKYFIKTLEVVEEKLNETTKKVD